MVVLTDMVQAMFPVFCSVVKAAGKDGPRTFYCDESSCSLAVITHSAFTIGFRHLCKLQECAVLVEGSSDIRDRI